jgi:hypothetical protein
MRKLLRMNDPINDILLETESVTPVWVANGNTSELSVKPKDVLPPEGTLLSCQMGNSVVVVFLPDESNPLNICLTVKFMQRLEEKSSFCMFKLITPSPPLLLGFLTRSQAARLYLLPLKSLPLQRQFFLCLSMISMTVRGSFREHM